MKKALFIILIALLFSCEDEVVPSNDSDNNEIQNHEDETVEIADEYSYTEKLPTYNFPDVSDVDRLKETVFSATLESDLEKNKNVVYAASLLMAWDEIETTIGKELKDFESKELEKMYHSTSHQNVLLRNEYKTEVEFYGTEIKATAEFKKALPFSSPFSKNKEKLKFGKDKVNSFGFRGNEDRVRIVYYNNDNDFCISIWPRNKDHKIYLLKSVKYKKTFKENFDEINIKRKKQRANENNLWKRELNHDDVAKIPMIEFNLENDYEKMVGSFFYTSKTDSFVVLQVNQRTAFILNEKGAIIESVGTMVVDGVADVMEEGEIPPTPKKLIFDKKFMVFLKRNDAKNPYFALQVTNAELLKK